MKTKAVILLFLFLFSAVSPIQAATDEGYGEDSTALGQFVDSFETSGNVSVAVDVIRNSTLEAMELNFTLPAGALWLSGWSYRKSHNITGTAAGAQTDYQMGIKVYYGAGVDGTELINGTTFGKVYLDSKSQVDFDDINFTKSDGITSLNYWLEEKVDSSYALFRVKIDSIPISPNNVSVFIYYGNAGAVTSSDGDSTFIFFDDFLGGALDGSKWSVRQGSVTVVGGELILTGTGGTRGLIDSKTSFSSGIQLNTRSRWSTVQGGDAFAHFASLRDVVTPSWDDANDVFQRGGGSRVYYRNIKSTVSTLTGPITLDTVTLYHVYKIRWETGLGTFFQDGTQEAQHNTNIPIVDLGVVFFESNTNGFNNLIDWVFVRKYVSAEPTNAEWGTEETGPGYSANGYFTTVDYLSDPLANGSALVAMVITDIPVNTDIQLQFSNDTIVWTDQAGTPGNSFDLQGGFESVDVRLLNHSNAIHYRFNLSTTDNSITPRVNQSRLITTLGNASIVSIIQNVSGEWIEYRASAINASVGIVDGGNLNSTFEIDGDTFNVSEVVGVPGVVISINFTGVDPDAECVWVTIWYLYDGNLNHDFDIEMWNFESSAWVDDGHLVDGVVFDWANSTIYAMRIPNDFLSGGEVRVQLNHESPGNMNHDLFIDYIRLIAKIPSDVEAEVFQFFWIVIAIALMLIGIVLSKMWFEEGDP